MGQRKTQNRRSSKVCSDQVLIFASAKRVPLQLGPIGEGAEKVLKTYMAIDLVSKVIKSSF